jgi:hypothetical protein
VLLLDIVVRRSKSCRNIAALKLKVKVKVKQCRYRPGVAQRVPGSYGSQTSRQRHRMVVRLSAFTTRKYTWYSFLLEAESTPGP